MREGQEQPGRTWELVLREPALAEHLPSSSSRVFCSNGLKRAGSAQPCAEQGDAESWGSDLGQSFRANSAKEDKIQPKAPSVRVNREISVILAFPDKGSCSSSP